MSAEEILRQRKFFKSGYEYGMGGAGTGDKDKDGKKEIDCSHLVNSLLVGAGYRIPYEPTATLGSSKFYDEVDVDDVAPGDLLLWRTSHQHVGIVEVIEVIKGVPSGDFFGSQSSTGPASTKFGPKAPFWKQTPDKFLRPKAEYDNGPKGGKSVDPAPPAKPAEHTEPETPAASKPNDPTPVPSRKTILDEAPKATAEARAQWAVPTSELDEESDGYATQIPMDSGLFPIGVNLTWHGGVHLSGTSSQPVLSMTNGIVVAARLPEKDPEKPSYGSRNFVLVKHKTLQGDDFWSLYMHLLPILLKSDDQAMVDAMPWLYEMELTADGPGSTNFRPLPSTAGEFDPPRAVAAGEKFTLIDQREVENLHWYNVESLADGVKGWIAKTPRVKLTYKVHGLDDLKAGKVVKFNHPIQAGTCIGFMSNPDPAKPPFVHLEVFSEKLVSGGWTEVKDDDANDIVCDADGLKKLLNKAGDAQFLDPLTPSTVLSAYADAETRIQMWVRSYKFKSEWAVDWEDAMQRFDKDVAKLQGPEFNKYRFWKDAEGLGCDLPKGGMVYHYQPLIFKAVMFPAPPSQPLPPPAAPGEYDIDWGFVARLEGTRSDVYVPNKKGTVIGKSGPTVASGFDLGQIDKNGFDSYGFSSSIQTKLDVFVGKKGDVALAFVKANKCTLTETELQEVESKVKARYAKAAEKFFNKATSESDLKFKAKSKEIQTVYGSVYFQYGEASKTLRGNLVKGDIVAGVDSLLHYTTKTTSVTYKKTASNVMEFLKRRIMEADYLLKALPAGEDLTKAQTLIKTAKQTWKDASGESL
jgi:murein DD-endopeptidase MepM/ murein hydrolase activator NlpD